MNNGWIKIHRKILDNALKTKPDWAWLWVVILLMANHADNEIIWNGKKRIIKMGEFITSRQQLALQSGLHQSSIERALKYFKNEQQIEQQTNKRFRLIKVNNYSQYQQAEQVSEHQMNNKRTTNEQQLNTNKKNKNIKNDKNKEKIYKKEKLGKYVTMSQSEYDKLVERFGKEETDSMIESIDDYESNRSKKYKDYPAVVRQWFKKDGIEKKETFEDRLKKELGVTEIK